MTRLLLIEDDQDLALNISELLELNGFEVTLASNGQHAISLLPTTNPDIIVSDVRMPGMSGTEVLRSLKENNSFRNIPFIFISAIVDQAKVREMVNLGADDYLTKPFSFNELLAVIEARLTRFKEFKDDGKDKEWSFAALLTNREIQIVNLVSSGLATSEIAERLFISVRTVENHKYNIMNKLDIPKRQSLYRFLLKQYN